MNKIGLTIGQNTGLNLNKYIKPKPDLAVEQIVTPQKKLEMKKESPAPFKQQEYSQVVASSKMISSKKPEQSKSISDITAHS